MMYPFKDWHANMVSTLCVPKSIMQEGQKHDSTDKTDCKTQVSHILRHPADRFVCQIGEN